MKDELVNCKKCGTLFYKKSGREICDECFTKELELIDEIKKIVTTSGKTRISLEELSEMTSINIEELKDLVKRGRLFAIIPKLVISCRFCGIELENDEKTGFTCKKCLRKFSSKANELEKLGIDLNKKENEARKLNRRLRGGMSSIDNSKRYGFIQNYDL